MFWCKMELYTFLILIIFTKVTKDARTSISIQEELGQELVSQKTTCAGLELERGRNDSPCTHRGLNLEFALNSNFNFHIPTDLMLGV